MQHTISPALADYTAIQEVRYQFAQALDEQDWDLLLSLFTPTVHADYSAYGLPAQVISREALVGIFQHAFSRPGLATQHHSTNFRIRLADDRATSRSNFTGYHHIAGFAGGEEFVLRVEYTDELTKIDSRWQLQGVALRIFYVTGNPAILAS